MLGVSRARCYTLLQVDEMKVYGDIQSGNCYKIALLCALLEIEHEWIDIDILNRETSTDEFLSKNPNGKIPVLELDDGQCLWESNAMILRLNRSGNEQNVTVYPGGAQAPWLRR